MGQQDPGLAVNAEGKGSLKISMLELLENSSLKTVVNETACVLYFIQGGARAIYIDPGEWEGVLLKVKFH